MSVLQRSWRIFWILVSSGMTDGRLISTKSGDSFAEGRRKHCIFSFMTPLGIVLGIAFSILATSMTATQVEAVFDALAAETFLYIAVLDIIGEVFEKKENRWIKFVLIVVTFGFMALIAIWT